MTDLLRKYIDEADRITHSQLETFAAAFVKSVGAAEAERYCLIMDCTVPQKTVWRFELIEDTYEDGPIRERKDK